MFVFERKREGERKRENQFDNDYLLFPKNYTFGGLGRIEVGDEQ